MVIGERVYTPQTLDKFAFVALQDSGGSFATTKPPFVFVAAKSEGRLAVMKLPFIFAAAKQGGKLCMDETAFRCCSCTTLRKFAAVKGTCGVTAARRLCAAANVAARMGGRFVAATLPLFLNALQK